MVTGVLLAAMPVTIPAEFTVATAGLPDDQVTALFVASAGKTAALNCTDSPVAMDDVAGVTVMDVTFTAAGITVTVQTATLSLPSVVVAVTTVAPSAAAVTRPELLTVANMGTAEAQSRALFSASGGAAVAESCLVSPTARLIAVSLRVTDSTSLGPIPDPMSGQAEKSAAIRTHQMDAGRNRDFLI
jgi:hypothetical protein